MGDDVDAQEAQRYGGVLGDLVAGALDVEKITILQKLYSFFLRQVEVRPTGPLWQHFHVSPKSSTLF